MARDVEPEILRHEGHEGAASLSHDGPEGAASLSHDGPEAAASLSHEGPEAAASVSHEGHEESVVAGPAARILVVPGFLPRALCARVRAAMDAGTPEPAEILGDAISLDEQVRRAMHIEIDAGVRKAVETRLDAVRPRLASFFRLPLGPREGLSVLRYTTGGFYRRHCDRGEVTGWPAASRRGIAVVLFLSSSRAEEQDGAFAGGTLRLFDHDGAPGYDVGGQAGSLVAFPATLPHEVTVVTHGVRDTVVDWFALP